MSRKKRLNGCSSPRRTRSGEYLKESVVQRLSGPRDTAELEEMFPNETTCRNYLAALRWRRGFVCPHCGDKAPAHRSDRGLWRCPTCDIVSSPATGTLFDLSSLPLRRWFQAIWHVFATEPGANPESIAKVLGIARPGLSWGWLEHLRTIMVAASDQPLVGVVEVAKVPIELELPGRRNHPTMGHRMVAVAVESRGSDLGRVRIRRLSRVDASTMTSFVTDVVGPGSTLRTGRWRGYNRLRSLGYGHIVACGTGALNEGSLPQVELLTSMLRLWLRSVPAMSIDRIDYYLDELVFRFNEQGLHVSSDRGTMFRRIVQVAATTPKVKPTATRQAL